MDEWIMGDAWMGDGWMDDGWIFEEAHCLIWQSSSFHAA